MNTNFRHVNKEVKEIIENARLEKAIETFNSQPEKAFDGTVLEGRKRRFTVINMKDVSSYLSPKEQLKMWEVLEPFLEKIENGRTAEGKNPFNSYIVINTDEAYINEIVEVMKDYGHWE